MQDHANELVATTPRPSPRRVLRTTWAGAVAAVTASGLLLAAAPDAPDAPLAEEGRRLPAALGQPLDGRAGTTPQDVTPEQIVAVLIRANEQAREQGPDLSPAVAQAAAQLGMLYTTYQMQQLGPAGRNEALTVRDAPARASGPADDARGRGDAVPSAIPVSHVPDAETDDDTPANAAGAEADSGDRDGAQAAGTGAGRTGAGRTKADGTKAVGTKAVGTKADGTKADGTKAVGTKAVGTKAVGTEAGGTEAESQAARSQAPGTEPVETVAARTEPAGIEAAEPDTVGPRRPETPARRVSYHEVVLAAVRLATVLDATAPPGLVEVEQDARRQDPASLPFEDARERADRTLRESLLDTVTAFGGSTLGYANGRVPADVLCPLDFDPAHRLRCDAAERLEALSRAFEREFGRPIPITDSYRSFAEQVAVASAKPHLAAVPGTSNHGWGLAVDLGAPISSGTSPEYVWLRVHGPDFGWDNPSWARAGGMKPEPWHFEFFAAGPVPNRAIDPSDVGRWAPPASSDTTDVLPAHEATDPDERPKDRPAGDRPSGTDPRQPAAQPERDPHRDPASQKPTRPAPKPKPDPGPKPDPEPTPTPTPTDPAPAKPTPKPSPSDPTPTPKPTPTPTPTNPTPGPTPSPTTPTPDPTPSEPSQTPSQPAPTPSQGQSQPSPTPTTRTPSPAPSTPRSETPPEQTSGTQPSPTAP